MIQGRSAQVRLLVLLLLYSILALGLCFGGAALLDLDARRLRAGEAARFDLAALNEKLKGAIDDPSAGPLLAASTEQIARYSGAASGRVVLFAPNQSAVATRGPPWPANLEPLADGLVLLRRPGHDYVGVEQRVRAGRLLIAREVQATGPLRLSLMRFALVTVLLLLGLSAVAAWIVGRLFTARIASLNAVCTAVETGDVAARVPGATGNDELAVLSRHLNRMLAELERRIGNLRASSDRIAHDLRTPLSRLGSRLSFLADLPPDQHADQIQAARREIDGLIEAFNGLLDLREIETESGLPRVQFALADAIEDAIELYEAVAQDQSGFVIERRLDEIVVTGLPALITRAVANLIDNALRASPAQGIITVVARIDRGAPLIEVRDRGAGPPAAVLEALDDDLGQVSGWGGHGIGLSIVCAVARRHDGHFALSREGDETIAALWLSR